MQKLGFAPGGAPNKIFPGGFIKRARGAPGSCCADHSSTSRRPGE